MSIGNLEIGGEAAIPSKGEESFQLGSWQINPRLNEVQHRGESVRLEPRMMQTLVVLARNAGQAVTRDQLMDAVWGHNHITDDTLNRVVSRLRKILSNGTNDSVTIETLPRVGYRLIPPGGNSAATSIVLRNWRWLLGAAVIAAIAVAFTLLNTPDAIPSSVSTSTAARMSPVTTLPGREINPTFSPDGSQLAFAWSKPDSNTWQLYIRTIGTESLLPLTRGDVNDRAPAWSLDGRQIAFIRYENDESCSVNIIASTGGAIRRVTGCDTDADPVLAWTPNGNALIFSAPQESNAKGLDIIDLNTGAINIVTRPPQNELADVQPAVSADGKWLAYTRWHAFGVANIFLMPFTGGEARQITFDNLKVHGITWEPDSRHIVFSSNRGGDFGLWRVSVAGDAPQRLPVTGRAMDSPTMSADGHRIAWEDWTDNSEILSVSLDGTEPPQVLASSTRWDWSPRLSPDGERMAFASDRSGASEIWVQNLVEGAPLRLTGFGGPFTSNPSWSPDGAQIAFDTPAEGHFDIWVVDAAGGVPQRLSNVPSQERYPIFSPDGERVYFGSNRSGEWEIWQRELASGEETQLTTNGGYLAAEYGDWLYFSKNTANGGLWRKPLSGGTEVLVSDTLQAYHCTNWLIRDDEVFFTWWDREAQSTWLYRHTLASGDEFRLRELPDFVYKSGVDLTQDGQVVYGSEVESKSDIMMSSLD